jgi:hypothetical protein
VVRQTHSLAIFLYFLPDLLEVTKEHSGIFDIAVLRDTCSGFLACHAPFTV